MQETVELQQPLRWAKVGILGAVLAVCFIAIAMLGFEVNRKMSEQATASSDNIQWTLSQIEVEFLRVEEAVRDARDSKEPNDIAEFRRRFDILYSRLATFQKGSVYAGLRSELTFATMLAGVIHELDVLIPLVDAPNDVLATNLEELVGRFEGLEAGVRNIALAGINYFARVSDESRNDIWLTLMRVAALTIALVMALIILSVVLFQLYSVSQRSAESVRAASARLEAMVNSTLDAVIVIDNKGKIVEFNGAAEFVFGYSRDEVIDQPMVDIIIPLKYRKAHMEGMKRHLRDGTAHIVGKGRVQMEALRKNGEVFPCEFSIASAQSPQGVLFVSFLRDNSAQVAAELELLTARDEALAGERARAEFMAVMSHEMRTPLNGMLGTMELIKDTPLSQRQRDYIKIMETSGRLLLHHVNDVLDIARLDSGRGHAEKRPFALNELLIEVMESQHGIATANNTTVEVDMSELGQVNVLGDQQRLRQVLLNLVSNAIKFTRDGLVRIEAEQLGDSDVIEFRVVDSGIGISEENLERIFEDFVTLDSSYSRESGGTGLGLGIAKRLVETMDGSIGAESELGDGSLFWFRIPLPILSRSQFEMPVPVETTIAPAVVSASLDILVVEDNQINQLVVEEMLNKEGHRVTLANNGVEGVAAAALRKYDVILMDISMPRMDGVEACMAIRSGDGRSRDSRIIALTAHALPADIERFKDAGMNDALVKPISRTKLARVLSIKTNSSQDVQPIHREMAIIAEDVIINLFEDLGEERALGLVNNFIQETDGVVDMLVNRPSDDDKQLIGDIHKLAGSASLFGTAALGDTLRTLETLGKSNAADKMRDQLPRLETIWANTRMELTSLIHEGSDSD